MVVSVILARGGSKGIPRKNIVDLNGKPLLAYTIKASLESEVDETWVSTDDDEIAQIAALHGARVLRRPDSISDDKSSSESALLHFAENIDFDNVVFIQPTSPLLRPHYINEGLALMGEFDSVFSAYAQHWVPRWTKTLPTEPIGWQPDARPRRQDADEVYVENGSFYITTKDCLLKSELRFSGKIGVVEMPLGESYQVDTYDDLEFVKRLL
jgi:N-acylneuraminate cytidylyltransferase